MYEESPLEVEVWEHLHSGDPDRLTEARNLIAPLVRAASRARGMRPTCHLLLAASAAARQMAEAPMLSCQLGYWAAEATGTSIDDLANGDAGGLHPTGSDLIAAACFRVGHARIAAAKALGLTEDDPVFMGHHLAALDAIQVGLDLLDTAIPEHGRLAGALHLVEAVALARTGENPEPAFAAAQEMVEIAALDFADEWHTEFGQANLAAHRVAVAASLGQDTIAALFGTTTNFSGLSKERQAAVASDLASLPHAPAPIEDDDDLRTGRR